MAVVMRAAIFILGLSLAATSAVAAPEATPGTAKPANAKAASAKPASTKSAPAKPSAKRLTPEEIKAAFFDGKPFTASTPAGVKYKMTFTPDGKMTREPETKSAQKGEGTWSLSKDGFCTAWKGSAQNCYRLFASGDNQWSVSNGSSALATWSR
jgi:hypothetical protein